jgi:hypothetical protein
MPEQWEEFMMWIEIAVTVLLTFRIALFRMAHPQLLYSNNDAWLPEEKMNSKSISSLVMEK